MVRYIELAIPPGMEAVYNPIQDAALMARIGAKWYGSVFVDKKYAGSAYELKNAETGTTINLLWWREDSLQYCRIERVKKKKVSATTYVNKSVAACRTRPATSYLHANPRLDDHHRFAKANTRAARRLPRAANREWTRGKKRLDAARQQKEIN